MGQDNLVSENWGLGEHLTKEEIIRLGEAAAQLLGSDAFAQCVEAARADIFDEWLHTNPAQPEERESLYRLWAAFALVTQKLVAWKGAAQVEVHNAERRRSSAAHLN